MTPNLTESPLGDIYKKQTGEDLLEKLRCLREDANSVASDARRELDKIGPSRKSRPERYIQRFARYMARELEIVISGFQGLASPDSSLMLRKETLRRLTVEHLGRLFTDAERASIWMELENRKTAAGWGSGDDGCGEGPELDRLTDMTLFAWGQEVELGLIVECVQQLATQDAA